MAERPIANEAACPIALERLSFLLRASRTEVDAVVLGLPERQRAALAAFCYNRAHLRDLAYAIAPHCEPRTLLAAAGTAGLMLYDQSQDEQVVNKQQTTGRGKAISLASRV